MKKKLMYPLSAVSLSLLLVACSGQNTQTLSPEEEIVKGAEEEQAAVNRETEVQKAGNAAWSYEGETGPEHWGDLDPAYSACANGSEQSPINIEFSQVKEGKEMEAINIQYEPTTFSLVHNGHTVQANAASESNRIIVEEHEYKLAQFHFHTPSEHTFNNENYDMELHLVHTDETGKLAVLGVMIKEGEENKNLAAIWKAMPKEKTKEDIVINEPVDIKEILPQKQTFFHYDGSLTTPPCTEGVEWFVYEQPIEMSSEQIQAFQEIFIDNHRPVQPLNEREIIKH